MVLADPSDFTASRNSANPSTQVDLTWTDNETSETGYEIEKTTNPQASSPTWTAVTTTAENAESHTVTNLRNGERYDFRIRAVSDTDQSSWVRLQDVTSGAGYGANYGSAYGQA